MAARIEGQVTRRAILPLKAENIPSQKVGFGVGRWGGEWAQVLERAELGSMDGVGPVEGSLLPSFGEKRLTQASMGRPCHQCCVTSCR